MKKISMSRCLILSIFSFLLILLLGGGPVQAMDLPNVIDKTNCKKYKELLIPVLFRAVEKGDFTIPTGKLDFPYSHWNRFLEAGKKNAGKFDVNKHGVLIEKSTGKVPKYNVYGFPFPDVDPKDPKAADKIFWNFNFQKYRLMAQNSVTRGSWIPKSGSEERYIVSPEYQLYLQGRPHDQEIKNPENLLTLEIQAPREPMSVKGLSTMSRDYFDDRELTVYAYIPAIRRIRQTSGTTRSDPYMGSDGWQDLNYLWAGKNSSMTWKLVGEKTILVPFTSIAKQLLHEAPDGSVQRMVSPYKLGYQTPGWKGAPWAPTTMTYVPRSVWVIEQMPKDPYYNWGLHVNYVDKETNVIWYKEVYERSGDFRTWVMNCLHYGEAESGKNNVGDNDVQIMIDEKARHASAFGRTNTNDPGLGYLYLPESKMGIDFFGMSHFLLLSK